MIRQKMAMRLARNSTTSFSCIPPLPVSQSVQLHYPTFAARACEYMVVPSCIKHPEFDRVTSTLCFEKRLKVVPVNTKCFNSCC